MIFVTVGTHPQSFDRLIKEVDNIAKESKENFFVQIGNSSYNPKYCKYKRFISVNAFEKKCKMSDMIITNAGVGTIMSVLKFEKPIIVVPRLKEFGEHVDNHQLDIAKVLERNKIILAVYKIENIKNKIKEVKRWKPMALKQKDGIINAIGAFLESIDSNETG